MRIWARSHLRTSLPTFGGFVSIAANTIEASVIFKANNFSSNTKKKKKKKKTSSCLTIGLRCTCATFCHFKRKQWKNKLLLLLLLLFTYLFELQGCALRAPGRHWQLTFAFGRQEIWAFPHTLRLQIAMSLIGHCWMLKKKLSTGTRLHWEHMHSNSWWFRISADPRTEKISFILLAEKMQWGKINCCIVFSRAGNTSYAIVNRYGTRIFQSGSWDLYVWSNWGPNYFWGVPKSFAIHLIHVTFNCRLHPPVNEFFFLPFNPYTSSIRHRLNPKFAAIETLLAICLNNDHVVHPLNGSLP